MGDVRPVGASIEQTCLKSVRRCRASSRNRAFARHAGGGEPVNGVLDRCAPRATSVVHEGEQRRVGPAGMPNVETSARQCDRHRHERGLDEAPAGILERQSPQQQNPPAKNSADGAAASDTDQRAVRAENGTAAAARPRAFVRRSTSAAASTAKSTVTIVLSADDEPRHRQLLVDAHGIWCADVGLRSRDSCFEPAQNP